MVEQPPQNINHLRNHGDDDIDRDDDDDDDTVTTHEQNEARAVMATIATTDAHPRNNNNNTTTAAERAIMGVVDPNQDGDIQDFIFMDENGQLVQQRFLQFLND
jgi:hypothetical protein